MPFPEKRLTPNAGPREWFGHELRQLRKARGLTQEELAKQAHSSESAIGKIEKAERPCNPELARELDRVLDTGGVLARAWQFVVAQADRSGREAYKRPPQADDTRDASSISGSNPVIREMLASLPEPVRGEPLDRRKFLSAATAFALGVAVPEQGAGHLGESSELRSQVDQVAAACMRLGTQRRVGRADVARLNAIHSLYQSLDYQYGGGLVFESVSQVADAAVALLDREHPEQLRPELMDSIANLRLLAGWTAFDMCDHASGLRHFAGAERLATRAGNISLAIYVHYCQARQLQHLRQNRDALDVLRSAQEHFAERATPGARSVLDATIAPSLAALGDRKGALAALNRATDAFESMVRADEPPWIGWMDQAELAAQFGRVYRDFARQDRGFAEDAAEWTKRAIDGFDEGMQRSSLLNQVGLCSAWFLAGEPDTALKIGATLLEEPDQVHSARIKERIVNLARDAKTCAGRSDVDDFIAEITST